MARQGSGLGALDHPRGDDDLTHGRPDDHQRQRSDCDGIPSSRGERHGNCGRGRSGRSTATPRVGQRGRQGCPVAEQQRHCGAGAEVPDAADDARRAAADVVRRRPAAAGAAPRKELEIRNGNANPEPDDPALREVLQMGIADAQQALRLARRNAETWRIDPARVGIMGFSAGGVLPSGRRWPSDRTRRRISSCRSTDHRCRTSTCPRTHRRSSSRSVHHTST